MLRWWMASLALVASTTEALGQVAPSGRLLSVPQDKSWQHAETRLILPPTSAGLVRKQLKDYSDSEFDVIVTYDDPAAEVLTTLYVYRTLVPDVPLWFDRALAGIGRQPGF